MKTILVTGGLGYIGSHTVVQLLNNGYKVIIIDNLSNSKIEIESKIKLLTDNHNFILHLTDLNISTLSKIFSDDDIDVVIHFAGLKAVKESIIYPLNYYQNNISQTLNLLQVMEKYNVKKIIFSSSATVYGSEAVSPITEDYQIGKNILSPYGKTKWMLEEILQDLDSTWSRVILRYFNPIGCHPSGVIGEDPNDIPNNLFPYILKVASGEYPELQIYGDDYSTPDGTCIRDFIHVEDLATAHLLSIKRLEENGVHIYNVGTGRGYSVKELVDTFEKVNNIKLNTVIIGRRAGDCERLFADVCKIKEELGFIVNKSLEDMCRDGYQFVLSNKISQDLNTSIFSISSDSDSIDITELSSLLDDIDSDLDLSDDDKNEI